MKKSAYISSPGNISITRESDDHLDFPPSGWITIQVKSSGICGTDLHIFKGEYMGSYPIVPGHEFSGIITALGDGVSTLSMGEKVAVEPNLSCGNCSFCKENLQHFCSNWQAIGVTLPGGMATHVSVPQEAVFPIGELSFEEGAFMEPLSCVLHGIERLNPELGGRILLAGAGPIGILILRVLMNSGTAYIDIVEKQKSRLSFAKKNTTGSVYGSFSEIPSSFKYDAVIDATGVPAVMEQLISYVKPTGKVLLFGVPPKDSAITLNPFLLFSKELTVLSSFTSLRNSRQALQLMESGKIKVSDLVSHRFSLSDFAKALEVGLDNREGVMKIQITL